MNRRPQRSTLVPYTTPLPIPRHEPGAPGLDLLALTVQRMPQPHALARLGRRAVQSDEPGGVPGGLPPIVHAPDQDRKSTRLNSSHANISYAVFCLKKNTKLIQ